MWAGIWMWIWSPILRLTGRLGWSMIASPTTLHIGRPYAGREVLEGGGGGVWDPKFCVPIIFRTVNFIFSDDIGRIFALRVHCARMLRATRAAFGLDSPVKNPHTDPFQMPSKLGHPSYPSSRRLRCYLPSFFFVDTKLVGISEWSLCFFLGGGGAGPAVYVHSNTSGGGGCGRSVLFSSAAGGAYWLIAVRCPSLGPFSSIGGDAHWPLTLCPCPGGGGGMHVQQNGCGCRRRWGSNAQATPRPQRTVAGPFPVHGLPEANLVP